jgi:DNA-directed RNA polymerase specialized sigma24 family protein
MIAIQKTTQRSTQSAVHTKFLEMLPSIRRQASVAFRNSMPDAREELIAEVVAKAFRAFCRLVERGKEDVAFATPLAQYSIRQVRSGRLLGGRRGLRDVMSARDQHRGFEIDRLGHCDREESQWREIVVEDHRAGPAEIAACRIDFANWLRLLPRHRRKIALKLATGESTSETAKRFGISSSRVSQLRLWLKENWSQFQGEADAAPSPLAAAC